MTTFLMIIFIKFSAMGQCSCYEVQGLNIIGADSMELILSNACDDNVYLNLYAISTISPFDTLGKKEGWSSAVLPLNTSVSNFLSTSLTSPPTFGTYRISITNRTLVCDSLQFSSVVSIANVRTYGSLGIYPNPLFSFATLQTEISLRNATLNMINKIGKTVKRIKNISGHTIPLHRDNLPIGLYFIRLIQDDKVIATDKIVIIN